ncbi:MAG: PEP-CTERM sorting domain-containing protein [Gallionella sp.]|nr:PEP-CTERM sorting domain-containing protein [Gallionella sp.]MDD4946026.1 PEP-CTERM sorting domain-containing protein [Gallionella sp.]MDD5612458.1 PEP-CTERM sorting domain-containing protein [Gallionella sp.]
MSGSVAALLMAMTYPIQLSPTVAVSEPETYGMIVAGLGLLGFATRRREQGLDLA